MIASRDPALPVLDTDGLFAATPVFDRVTLAQCLKREFILLRQTTSHRCVRRPLRSARLAWIDDCLHGAPLYLVHADDLRLIWLATKKASTPSNR